jgi:hypothetical protein
MTPDTLPIDVRIKGVGRIHRASGTTDKVVRRKIVRMLKALRDAGRLDILRAIRDGHVTLLQVYDASTRNALADLPIGNTMPLLATAMKAWIEDARPDYSAKHIENHDYAQRQFEKEDKDGARRRSAALLEALRKTYGARHPRTFNIYRASALSFARATLKRSHPIYMACLAVEERAVPKRKSKPQLTVDAIRGFFPNPDTRQGRRIVWAMVTTGMHAKEYWGEWHAESDRIHIGGTKRGGRVRDVPLDPSAALPPLSRDRFVQRLFGSACGRRASRRTTSGARMRSGSSRPGSRARGGSSTWATASDVTDLYERHEVAAFLVADAKTLGAYLGITPPDATTKTLEVMK